MTESEITQIIACDDFSKGREAVDAAIRENPRDDTAYYCLGRLLWKFDRRAEALSAYTTAVRLNPDSPARHALEMAQGIFDFFNPDLLNP